jgi:hypothetical protein
MRLANGPSAKRREGATASGRNDNDNGRLSVSPTLNAPTLNEQQRWSQRLQQLVAQVPDSSSAETELRQLIAAVGSLHYWVLVVERCRQAAQNRLATRIAPLSARRALLALMNSMVPWESACDGASPTLRVERKYGRVPTGHDYGNGMRMSLGRQSASIYV